LLARGLTATAAVWPALRRVYAWVHRAAHRLANGDALAGLALRRAYRRHLAELTSLEPVDPQLQTASAHFRNVTRSYWRGLFRCYDVPDLPRTNNTLEQFFGSARYHERRATGRKFAAPGTVVRGAVRLVAAVATRQAPFTPEDLRPPTLAAWRTRRRELDFRHEARRAQCRFRRDPAAYLARLENALLQSTLPS
jgi:hypothetical protein